jgi:hypothetical protein
VIWVRSKRGFCRPTECGGHCKEGRAGEVSREIRGDRAESAEEQFAGLASKAARDVRATERKAARLESAARETAEKVARKAAEVADRDAETTQQATRDAPSEAERKAARDARYAARKARTRK